MTENMKLAKPVANLSLVELAAFGIYYFFLFATGVMKLALKLIKPMFGMLTKKPLMQMVMTCVAEIQNIGLKMVASVSEMDRAIQDGGQQQENDAETEKTSLASNSRESLDSPEELELQNILAASQSLSMDVTSIQNIVALTVDVTMKAAHRQFQKDLKAIIAKQMENNEQKKYNLNLQLMNLGAKC